MQFFWGYKIAATIFIKILIGLNKNYNKNPNEYIIEHMRGWLILKENG